MVTFFVTLLIPPSPSMMLTIISRVLDVELEFNSGVGKIVVNVF